MKDLKVYTVKNLQKRLLVLILLIAFIFVVIVCRLAYLQVFSSEFLNIKASEQWFRDLPITASRGEIYDRNGTVLATSKTTYNVYVRANSVKDVNEVASHLSNLLELNFDNVYEKISNKKVSEVLIKLQVNEETGKKIIALNLSGVYLSLNVQRQYAFGDFLSQILGYTTIDGIGQAGLEAYYNNLLTGVNGKILTEADVIGRKLDNSFTYYTEPISGLNLTLTIDYQIENIIENVLDIIMQEQAPKKATAIVMDPNTGEIIGMSTKNSFDLNSVPRNDINLLNELSKASAIVDVLEPGSTFKLFTLATALELGLTNLKETFYCPGYRMFDGQKIKCWKTTGHGSQTLEEGVCHSCNCVFMDLAYRIGIERLYSYIKSFGFGAKTGIDFFSESSGILMKQSSVKTVDLVRIGFGHAIAVTPLQMITAVSAIVNGGNLLTPYLVKSISNDSRVISTTTHTVKAKTINETTADLIKQLMLAVVEHGNGTNASYSGFKIGGKTGTAQKYENGKIAQGKYVSSFVGFAPYDNPKYVVMILVDEPSQGVYYGSLVATPYAKQIFSNIFEIKNIEKTSDETEEFSVTMPDVIGLSLAQAIIKIKNANLQFELDGEGTIVTEQLPPAGTVLKAKSVVLIKT